MGELPGQLPHTGHARACRAGKDVRSPSRSVFATGATVRPRFAGKYHIAMIPALNLLAYIKDNDFKAVARDNELLKEAVASMSECYDILEAWGYEMIPRKQASFVRKHKHMLFWFLNSRGGNTKLVAAFSTAGAMDGAKRIVSIVKEKGIKAHNETLPIY